MNILFLTAANEMERLAKRFFFKKVSKVFRHYVTNILKVRPSYLSEISSYYKPIQIRSQLTLSGHEQRLLKHFMLMVTRAQNHLIINCCKQYVIFYDISYFLKNIQLFMIFCKQIFYQCAIWRQKIMVIYCLYSWSGTIK